MFIVTGLVPTRELKDESLLRRISGAEFPLKSGKKFSRYCPNYTPTLLGVSKKGKIYLLMPSIPGTNETLSNSLVNFYKKVYPILLKELHPDS